MLIFFRNLEKKRRKRGLLVENKDHRANLTKERGEPVHKLKQVDFSPAGEDWNIKYNTYIVREIEEALSYEERMLSYLHVPQRICQE